MKLLHSRIRATATLLYASAHPEIRYKDVAIALGYSEVQADTVVSGILRKAGFSRPRGFASPSYSPKAKAKIWKRDAWSRARALKMLEWGMRQVDIAEKLGCSQFTISALAVKTGVGGFAKQRAERVERQKRLINLLEDNPCATLAELAEETNTVESYVSYLLRDMGLCTFGQERREVLAKERKRGTA